jgi:hypothetical protein
VDAAGGGEQHRQCDLRVGRQEPLEGLGARDGGLEAARDLEHPVDAADVLLTDLADRHLEGAAREVEEHVPEQPVAATDDPVQRRPADVEVALQAAHDEGCRSRGTGVAPHRAPRRR